MRLLFPLPPASARISVEAAGRAAAYDETAGSGTAGAAAAASEATGSGTAADAATVTAAASLVRLPLEEPALRLGRRTSFKVGMAGSSLPLAEFLEMLLGL